MLNNTVVKQLKMPPTPAPAPAAPPQVPAPQPGMPVAPATAALKAAESVAAKNALFMTDLNKPAKVTKKDIETRLPLQLDMADHAGIERVDKWN